MRNFILFIIASVVFLSCKKNKNDDPASAPTIYALVSENLPTGGAKFTLWKDGQFTTIIEQDEAGLAGLDVTDNGDVYICGYQPNLSGTEIAKYWKNGTPTTLSTLPSDANDIKVNANDIYVAGREGQKAIVWKNGSPAYLTNGIYQAVANSVFVNGTDVYAGGNINNSALKSVAHIWKNNLLLSTLSDGTKDAYVRSIFINGSDVYACGFDYYSGDMQRPVIWKNGVKSYLGNNRGDAQEVIVVNNDVYVAGWENSVLGTGGMAIAKYWKNGVATLIGQNGYSSICTSIKVVGDIVYCTGTEKNPEPGNPYVAKYWRNGTPTTFKIATSTTESHKIFIK